MLGSTQHYRRGVERRRLGSSGIEVSRLSLGAMTFGTGMPPISNVDATCAEAMLEQALDAGVNLVDTANAYSAGESEQMLAPLLARHRDELLVATKIGFGAEDRPLSRTNVITSVEESLRRLGTDRIDVLYLHRPDRATPIEETFDALDELVARGVVRTVGVSNWTAGETGFAVGRQRGIGGAEPTSVQVYWSLVGREVEHEIVPTCRRLGLGVVVWSPLAAGYLTGRADGRRAAWSFPPVDAEIGARVLRTLRRVADELDATPGRVALAWLLQQRDVTSVIVGASSPAQLHDNLAAAALMLDETHLQALDDASRIPPTYTRWWDAAMGISAPSGVDD
jgi:aryl-alcohol dehydrogenase-like predicted oxidoreductase